MATITPQQIQRVIEKVETLAGERGDQAKRAIRLGEITSVREQLAGLVTSAVALKKLLDSLNDELTTLVSGLGTAATLDLSTDGTLAADSDALLPTQRAVKEYVDDNLPPIDALVFRGVIDCSGDPDYPAAVTGDVYRVSVAGKIGGAAGVDVENGDLLLCITDNAGGSQAAVGADWSIGQTNIDGAVTGPTSSVDGEIALFSGSSGRIIARAAVTGLLKAASGVLAAAVPGTDFATAAHTHAAGEIRGDMVLQQQTTDATPTQLTTDGAAPDAGNTFVLADHSAVLLRLQITAFQSGGIAGTVGDSAGWNLTALLSRGASSGTVVIVGSPSVAQAYANAGAASWAVALAAETVLGGLDVAVTGEADKTIEWTARILSATAPAP